jgi:hypothetical protein
VLSSLSLFHFSFLSFSFLLSHFVLLLLFPSFVHLPTLLASSMNFLFRVLKYPRCLWYFVRACNQWHLIFPPWPRCTSTTQYVWAGSTPSLLTQFKRIETSYKSNKKTKSSCHKTPFQEQFKRSIWRGTSRFVSAVHFQEPKTLYLYPTILKRNPQTLDITRSLPETRLLFPPWWLHTFIVR